jgi:hypothetical protein
LGQGLPEHDVLLSPAQKVTVLTGFNDTRELNARDVSRGTQSVDRTLGMVAYYELHLEAADDVCCQGIWVKSAGALDSVASTDDAAISS